MHCEDFLGVVLGIEFGGLQISQLLGEWNANQLIWAPNFIGFSSSECCIQKLVIALDFSGRYVLLYTKFGSSTTNQLISTPNLLDYWFYLCMVFGLFFLCPLASCHENFPCSEGFIFHPLFTSRQLVKFPPLGASSRINQLIWELNLFHYWLNSIQVLPPSIRFIHVRWI